MQSSLKEVKVFVACAVLVLSFSGCDKVTNFLSDYFPSLKKSSATDVKEVSAPKTPAPVSSGAISGDVLARVGGWTMTASEFKDRLAGLKEVAPDYDTSTAEAKKMILDELINQQLLVQDAENSNVATKKEVADAVNEFRRTLLVREVAMKVTEGITVTDADVTDYYEKNKNNISDPIELKVREIMVPTKDEAQAILMEILNGADFAETAKNRSKTASAEQGGDLGFIREAKFPQMGAALAILDVGGVSAVFNGPDGYYIVKVEEKRGGNVPALDDKLKEEIKSGLTILKQQEALLKHIEKIKEKTNIQINENLLKE